VAVAPDEAEANEVEVDQASPPPAEQLPVEVVEPNVVAALEDAPARSAPSQRESRPAPSLSNPTFRFAQSVVTIGEGQTAAAVTIERSGANVPATIVWWTSGDTALADEDFADLGQRTERFATGESSRTIYVPLVADSLPERTETLFVYVGRFEAGRTNIQQLANVRVNIRDDD
jgi:hypothetical protein